MITEHNTPLLAQKLARVHKAITRGFTVGTAKGLEFAQHGFPDPETRQGYIDYIQSLISVIAAHHAGEDEILFPLLKERFPSATYDQLSADHHEIEVMVDALRATMVDVAGQVAEAALSRLGDGLRRITAIWMPHIQTEEAFLSQEAFIVAIGQKLQGRADSALAKHAQEHATPALTLPFVLFNLDGEDRAAIAASMPDMIVQELIPKAWREQWAPMLPFLLE